LGENKEKIVGCDYEDSYFAESNCLSPQALSGRPKKEKIMVKQF
jgi:hypothetical protein